MQRDTCGLLIKKIHDAVGRHVNNALRERGLTLAQVRVLMELRKDEGTAKPLKELERRFHVAQPTVAGVVHRLEAKGLVRSCSDPEDSRVKLVHLTPEGEKFLNANMREIEEMEKRLVKHLTETEQQELLRMLHTVYDNVK